MALRESPGDRTYGTDLSAGRCVGLCACICASLLQSSGVMNKMFPSLAYSVWLIPIGLLISMAVGGLVGAFNGFMVSKFKLHPFIVTLGTQLILYGMVMWYVSLGQNNSAPIAGLDQTYIDFIKGGFKIGGVQIPNYLWITVAVTIVMWIIWNKTKLGKNMFAVGTNQEAAAVSGVNVAKTIILVFALAGNHLRYFRFRGICAYRFEFDGYGRELRTRRHRGVRDRRRIVYGRYR